MRAAPRLIASVLAAVAIGVGLWDGWPGRSAFIVLGFPDCEVFGSGLLVQPTNALTSLVFVPLGVWIVGDARLPEMARSLLGATVAGVGVGSFLSHAAATDWARTLDSVAINVMLVTLVVYLVSRRYVWAQSYVARVWIAGAGAVIALGVGSPLAGDVILTILVIAAVALTAAAVDPAARRWFAGGLAALGLGAIAWWLGRSGAALCDPDAVFQLHGVWHILAAAGIASVYQVNRVEMS